MRARKQWLVPALLACLGLSPSASAADAPRVLAPAAVEFPLSAVKLLEGPFKQAMEVDKAYLLRLEPDRLLAGFRVQAGLEMKAEPYGGWERYTATNRYTMAGHSLGHYLSALSMMAAATGDAECGRRVEYIVSELAACQKAGGDGMLFAGTDAKALFAELRSGNIQTDRLFRLNRGYVPFYSIHKVMAGLRDAHRLCGHAQARVVLIAQADWVAGIFEKLTDAQVQEILETEHGGIMGAMADVYQLTGEAKYLAAARRLNHAKVFEPMAAGEDKLGKEHANAQIPKVIGMQQLYEITGEAPFGKAADFFYENVAKTRTFVIGGHGANEFFFPPTDFATTGITSDTGPETCNTYNMIKLGRQLWLMKPAVDKADFIERGLVNHILPSQDPEHGGFVYFTSMRPGHYRTYSSDTGDFWCCTGTGMENYAKFGSLIFAHTGTERLWVDQMIASELTWEAAGLTVKLESAFPEEGKAKLTFGAKEPRRLALMVRTPGWLKEGAMRVAVNGTAERLGAKPGTYAAIERTWKTGDVVEIDWPLEIRTEPLPGGGASDQWVAVLRGPVALAGTQGKAGLETFDFNNSHQYAARRNVRPMTETPVFKGTAAEIPAKVQPVAGEKGVYETKGLGAPADVRLEPFYRVHRQRYAIYWKVQAP